MVPAGSKLYEYLLILSPDWRVSLEISKIKQLFAKHYDCKFSHKLKAHITLVNFVQYDYIEKHLIKHFGRFALSTEAPAVELSGFGEFPTHTIYVKIGNPLPLVEVVKRIRGRFRHLLKATEKFKPAFITTPHVTVARGMTEEQFEQAWNDWSKKDFNASFTAKEMLLLRKPVSQPSKGYEHVGSFQFSGSVPKNRQLELFSDNEEVSYTQGV